MLREARVVIRTASPTDTDAVSNLLEASYSLLLASDYDRSTLDLALRYMVRANPQLLASGTYYVAETERRTIVGCGGWTAAKPGTDEVVEGEAHIRHFAVHPDWIKCGIGTALLTRCIEDARSRAVHKLHCFSTLNAEPFYRGLGFQTIDLINVPMTPTVDFPAVLMQLEIS
jgi:N-acetylglutamate synthase-like GNAT family acetyltransferase